MIIQKITTGFVIQEFDTETKQFTSQHFVAGEVEYENNSTNPGQIIDSSWFEGEDGGEAYLPFDMVQPPKEKQFGLIFERGCFSVCRYPEGLVIKIDETLTGGDFENELKKALG